MFRHQVCCDVYRNGELLIEENFLLHEPIVCEENEFDELEAYAIADESLKEEVEKRIAEEMWEDVCASGSVLGGYIQIEFREPEYNTKITEIYDNFRIKKVDTSDEHIYHHIDIIEDEE